LGLQKKIFTNKGGSDDRAKVLAGLRAASTIQTHANRLHAIAGAHQIACVVTQIQASTWSYSCASSASQRSSGAEDVSEKIVGHSENTGTCTTIDCAEKI